MSMNALNQLVGRSIIDPEIVEAFTSGRISEIIEDFDFSIELRQKLAELTADTWAEFAVMAYRLVKLAEPVDTRLELPSPAEGLQPVEEPVSREQVA